MGDREVRRSIRDMDSVKEDQSARTASLRRNIVLTGRLGVGKSTLQARLVTDFGFWTPTTVTTRPIESTDPGMRGIPLADFIADTRAGRLLLPAAFGGYWYAWARADIERLAHSEVPAVLNVRPYTALVLHALLPRTLAVWLWVDDAELERRTSDRHAARDSADARRKQDEIDQQYEDLFAIRVCADDQAVTSILAVSEGSDER